MKYVVQMEREEVDKSTRDMMKEEYPYDAMEVIIESIAYILNENLECFIKNNTQNQKG